MQNKKIFVTSLFVIASVVLFVLPAFAHAYVSPLNPPLDNQFRCNTNGGNGTDGGVPACSWEVRDWSGTPSLWAGYFLLRKQDGSAQNQRNLFCEKYGGGCDIRIADGSNNIVVNPGEPVWVEWSSEPYVQLRAYESGCCGGSNQNGDLYIFMDHPRGGYNQLDVPGNHGRMDYWGGMWVTAPGATEEWQMTMGRVSVRAFRSAEILSYTMSIPAYVEAAVQKEEPKSVSFWQDETAVNWDNRAGTVHYRTTGYTNCTMYGSNGLVWDGYVNGDWWTNFFDTDARFDLYCTDKAGKQEGPWTLWFGINPYGVLDAASCTLIGGWACDQSGAAASIDVHVYADGAFLQALTAGGYRADVPAAGDCNGVGNYHGFTMVTPESLKDGKTHTVSVYAINYGLGVTNTQLIHSPKTVQCEIKKSTGSLDGFRQSTSELYGWAYNEDKPDSSIGVAFYVDGTAYAQTKSVWEQVAAVFAAVVSRAGSATANQARADINNLGIPGNRGFSWTVPEAYRTGTRVFHAYAIEPSGALTELPNSPKTVTFCEAGYTGFPPNCTQAANCPSGYTGTPPNCVAPTCGAGYTGTYPNCTATTCASGYTGTPPNCVAVETVVETQTTCPSGQTGTPPNCVTAACPIGYGGTYPNCTCPYGGTYPSSCACQTGYRGTYPSCTALVPSLTLTANPARLKSGNTSELSWSAVDVASCSLSGVGVSGSCSSFASCEATHTIATPVITEATQYTLTCGNLSKTVTIQLIPTVKEI